MERFSISIQIIHFFHKELTITIHIAQYSGTNRFFESTNSSVQAESQTAWQRDATKAERTSLAAFFRSQHDQEPY
jgi:hypothetical protein